MTFVERMVLREIGYILASIGGLMSPTLHAIECRTFLFDLAIVVGLLMFYLLYRRSATKAMLERGGLPTVYWTPRFVTYRPFEGADDQKLASSTITKILPRMNKLCGPFGMYGTVYGISTPVVHVAHPVPAKAILNGTGANRSEGPAGTRRSSSASGATRRHSNSTGVASSSGASKAPAYNHFKNFCGDGVFTADGNDWKVKRAAVLHHLVKGVTTSGLGTAEKLQKEANHAADVFCQQVHSLKEATSQTSDTLDVSTNIVPLLQRATIGLIYRYITHHDPDWAVGVEKTELVHSIHSCDEFSNSETESLSSDDEVVSSPERSSKSSAPGTRLLDAYLNSIVRIRMIILAQSRSIWFLLPSWCYRFFSSMYRDEEETLYPIRVFAHEACRNAKPGSPLYCLGNDAQGPHFSVTASGLSTSPSAFRPSKILVDEAITLLFAGQDTSAATLSWTLHLLSLYPDIQGRLFEEIREVMAESIMDKRENVFPRGGTTPWVTKSTIAMMPLLDAIIKESMRLYPVAPFIVRRLTDDVTVLGDASDTLSVVLPARSVVCIWIYGLHRNPEFWNRPNDFIPDRWLDPTLKDVGQSNGAYMPFASGPRNCLGQPLAHIILRTVLAKLVFQYEFIDTRLSNETNPDVLRKDMQAGFTVLPAGGVDLMIRQRKENN